MRGRVNPVIPNGRYTRPFLPTELDFLTVPERLRPRWTPYEAWPFLSSPRLSILLLPERLRPRYVDGGDPFLSPAEWVGPSAALDALEALEENEPEFVETFLRDWLRLGESKKWDYPSLVEASWRVMSLSGRWLEIDPEAVLAYLRVAIMREAQRLYEAREESDRLWTKLNQEPVKLSRVERTLKGSDDPEKQLNRKEELQLRRQILRDLLDQEPEPTRQLLRCLLAGSDPAEAVASSGGTWSTYQALQRKASRRLKQLERAQYQG